MVCFFLPFKVGFTSVCSEGNFLYHFFHANIFHLIGNLIGLYYFKPRWSTSIVALLLSSVLSMIPVIAMDAPTYGLSAFLFAAYARKYAGFRLSIRRVILFNLLLALLPNVNWKIHLICFLVSYLVWRVFYYVRSKQVR